MSNDTQTLTLTDFLLARIAETEQGALDRWNAAVIAGHESLVLAPSFVLTDSEGKRRIVEEHRPGGEARYCGCCWLDDLKSWEPYPCPTAKALALPYADHPDYREEWRP